MTFRLRPALMLAKRSDAQRLASGLHTLVPKRVGAWVHFGRSGRRLGAQARRLCPFIAPL
jgi:hypothetical protein